MFVLYLFACDAFTAYGPDYNLHPIDTDDSDSPILMDTDDTDIVVDTDLPIETDRDTSDTGYPDPTGLTGGILQLSYTQTPCPSCFTDGIATDAYASAAFHNPEAGYWNDWVPLGSCVTSAVPDPPGSVFYDVGAAVGISDGFTTTTLTKTFDGPNVEYHNESMNPAVFTANAFYDLQVGANGTLGVFTVPQALKTPSAFTLTSPAEMMTSDWTQAFAPVVSKSGTYLSWSPADPDGTVIVILEVYSLDGMTLLGGVLCASEDYGSLYVPGSHFASFPSYAPMATYINKERTVYTVIPPNGSTLEAVGVYSLRGTATLVP